ncbi:MAG: ABC transporter substrate-binding protein [Deltaproteobacteria bacterium]|nr:ABC transporter substrate-binding protein [Deltaproteobacteria bacterium]
MKKKGVFSLLGTGLLLTLSILTLATSAFSQPTNRKPVVIGNLACFTGHSADTNPWMLRGAELACHEFGWKVAGRKIKLVNEDSASNPTVAADKTKKLMGVDKADVFIGPLPAVAAFPVAALLKSSGTPLSSIMEFPSQLLKAGDHVFAHTGTQRGTGFFVGVYAYDVMGYSTATVIHDDIIFAEEFTQGAMDGFVSRGGKIIQRQRTPMNTMDWGPYLTAMKKADCCMFWFVPFHAVRFISQYSQYGFKMPLVQGGCTTLGLQNLMDLGDKALNLISGSAYDAYIKGPEVKNWVDRWVKLHGKKSEKEGRYPYYTEGCSMYSAVSILLQAIQSTKGDTTPAVLRSALKKGKFKTPWGPVSFNKDRVGIGNAYIMKVVKEGNSYSRTDAYKYENVARDEPAEAKNAAPKM